MEVTSWPIKKAKRADRVLDKLVQEMNFLTTQMNLDLVNMCNKYMKSLPAMMSGNARNAKKYFCNTDAADLRVYQDQRYLETRIKKCSVNCFNVYKKKRCAMWLSQAVKNLYSVPAFIFCFVEGFVCSGNHGFNRIVWAPTRLSHRN